MRRANPLTAMNGLHLPVATRSAMDIARSALLAIVVLGAATGGCARARPDAAASAETRRALLSALRPVRLANCTLKRYGDTTDGGYLMCENLMGDAQAAYSYGIDGRDHWGCDVSRQLALTVHQYDCFNLKRFQCDRGRFEFHEECIGDRRATLEGRPFDTLPNQLARNGDAGKRLIVKMDVEGSEWSALLETPDAVLDSIDQLAIEFHGVNDPRFVAVVEKLKRHFYVAHFHSNNWSCDAKLTPMTAWANQALLVSKRVGVLDSSGAPPALPHPLDAPDGPKRPDCQPAF